MYISIKKFALNYPKKDFVKLLSEGLDRRFIFICKGESKCTQKNI